MAEYIDREALKKNFESRHMDYRNRSEKNLGNGYWAVDDTLQTAAIIMKSCLDTVCETPAADVAEVRHGEWIVEKYSGHFDVKCSACSKSYYVHEKGQYRIEQSNFCPNCGAKMDGKDE